MGAIRVVKHERRVPLGLGAAIGLLLLGWFLLSPSRPNALPSNQLPAPKGARGAVLPGRERALEANDDTPRAPQLRGRVRDEGANPIASASVCLRDEEHLADSSSALCVVTDKSGQFAFLRTFAKVQVLAAAAGFLPESASPDLDAPDSELVITLRAATGNVSGRVVDATGGPVAGTLVIVRRPNDFAGSMVQSDAQGGFSVGFAEGDVEVSAQPESYSRASVLSTAPVSGIVLVVTPASSIVGRVVSAGSGQPIANIRVLARADSGPDALPSTAQSAPDGSFELKGLSAGRYQLSAIGSSARSPTVWVNVGVGEASAPVLLAAQSSVSLSGTLRVNGEPCANGSVEFSGPTQVSAEVALGGGVQAEGLLPGHYRVAVECSGGVARVEALQVADLPLNRDWDLSRGLAIGGTVQDPAGKPVGGASIVANSVVSSDRGISTTCTSDDTGLFTCSGLTRGSYEVSVMASEQGNSDPVRVAVDAGSVLNTVLRVAASGTIRAKFDGLAPGAAPPEVIVKGADPFPLQGRRDGQDFVFSGVRLGQYRVYVGAADEQSSGANRTAAVQRAGEVVTVSLRAPPLRNISGRVVDADGAPVPDAWVRATPTDPFQPGSSSPPVLTDERGAFLVSGLTAARYDLAATSAHGDGSVAATEPGAAPVLIRLTQPAELSVKLRTDTGTPVPVFSLSYSRDDSDTTRVSAEDGIALARLAPGTYRLEALADAGQTTETVTLTSGRQLSVTLVVSSSKAAKSSGSTDVEAADPESASNTDHLSNAVTE